MEAVVSFKITTRYSTRNSCASFENIAVKRDFVKLHNNLHKMWVYDTIEFKKK